MAQVLHWLLLFSCQPSQTLQHGLEHGPLCFSVSKTSCCPCLPSPGGQAGTWQLSAQHARSTLLPRGSGWAPCLSSLQYREPSSLSGSNHCLQADDGSDPHTRAASLKPPLLPMCPAGSFRKLQNQHRNNPLLPTFCQASLS